MVYNIEFENDYRFKIVDGIAREVLDSRGNPTIEVEILTEGGGIGRASVPSGASKGKFEAIELRDGDASRYKGKGVLKAVENVNEVILPEIVGMDSRRQREIDRFMIDLDGTKNKSKLGANSILGVSLAVARAAADTYGLPLFLYLGGSMVNRLPTPLLNIINGGKHAGNQLAIQEFMIVPGGADSFSDALRMSVEVYQELKSILLSKYGRNAVNVGDEGGFAPPLNKTLDALDLLIEAIDKAGYTGSIGLALDAAASSFFDESKGIYKIDGRELSAGELLDFYVDLVEGYPILSIEDPFYEDDYKSFSEITKKVGDRVLIVGDDLFVTNIERFSKGINENSGNAILVKLNQIGTLTETIDLINVARENGFFYIISHRSGETEDNYIADLAVATHAHAIKTGAPARSDRTSKYNRLLQIEELLGDVAIYNGFTGFKRLPKG